MKRILGLLFMFILLVSCGRHTPTWQEQYDLGIRYLSEGSYEEAIIAFTAAIEIDPNQALAYVGRGDAYIGSGETEENLAAARADYEKAIELDETLEDAYLGLVKIYEKTGDYQALLSLLRQRIERAPSKQFTEILDKYQHDSFYNSDMFLPLSSLEEGSKNVLLKSLQLLQAGDTASLETMMLSHRDDFENMVVLYSASSESTAGELRTTFGGAKVQVHFSYSPSGLRSSTGEPGSRLNLKLELRPQAGIGYFYGIVKHDLDFSGEAYRSIAYTTGDCSNWNWNGQFEHISITTYPGSNQLIRRSGGTLINGLIDGEAYYEDQEPEGSDIVKWTHYADYLNGNLVLSWDGHFWASGYSIVTHSNGETSKHGSSVTNPDEWKDQCSNYQSGAGSSHKIREYELLWN